MKTPIILLLALVLVCLVGIFILNQLPQESVTITNVMPQVINLRG